MSAFSRAWAAESAKEAFEALPPIAWPSFDWLIRKGVPAEALIKPELPARANVVFHGSGLFDLADDDDDATKALVFLARDSLGEPVDMVAWAPGRNPAIYYGAASMLGEDDVFAARLATDGALPVHRTPRGWLKAGRAGVVPVDLGRALLSLRDLGPLVAEDDGHAREIREALRQPRIFVQSACTRRAA